MQQEISLLALVDTHPSTHEDLSTCNTVDDAEAFVMFLRDWGYDKKILNQNPVEQMMALFRREGHVFASLDRDQLSAMVDAYKNNVLLFSTYCPQRYNGNMILFTSSETLAASSERWNPYVLGKISVHELPFPHRALMNPAPLSRIGKILAKELEKQTTRPSASNAR